MKRRSTKLAAILTAAITAFMTGTCTGAIIANHNEKINNNAPIASHYNFNDKDSAMKYYHQLARYTVKQELVTPIESSKRVIGKVINNNGAGVTLDTKTADYISYSGVKGIHKGNIILTVYTSQGRCDYILDDSSNVSNRW